MIKDSLWGNVRRSKSYLLPTAFFRSGRNATAILGLPGRLRPLKHDLFFRVFDFTNRSNLIPLHHLRSICF